MSFTSVPPRHVAKGCGVFSNRALSSSCRRPKGTMTILMLPLESLRLPWYWGFVRYSVVLRMSVTTSSGIASFNTPPHTQYLVFGSWYLISYFSSLLHVGICNEHSGSLYELYPELHLRNRASINCHYVPVLFHCVPVSFVFLCMTGFHFLYEIKSFTV